MKLVIGDKNYSSWSMRPWLVLKHFGIAFEEAIIWLNEAQTRASILEHSPSGKVPCLIADDGVTVWDSLAICETLAERYPQHAMWPRDAIARGRARSVSAEMHSGFGALRNNMWMNIRASFPGKGAFTIADAMYAPVVMRFNTWQPKLSEAALAYSRRVTSLPAVKAWIDDALQETHRIPYQDTCA